MNVVIIGDYPPAVRDRILGAFPADWSVHIAPPAEAGPWLREAEALIPKHIPVGPALLDQAPGLRVIQTGVGYDNIDIPACTCRGIQVCSAAGVNADAVAEHVMAMLLCWYKNIAYLDAFMKERKDPSLLQYTGGELGGKTIGLIGLGAVARRVAGYCAAFGMRVLGYSRRTAVPGVEAADLETLYAESDVVSLHVPLTAGTRGLIGEKALSRMRPGALLINTSRGAVIDEKALIGALRSRRIAGACLDVYEQEPLAMDSPLRDLPNVLLTPHTAGLPDGVRFHEKRYRFFADNLARVLNGETPENRLNEIV